MRRRLRRSTMGAMGAGIGIPSYGVGSSPSGVPIDVIGYQNRSGLSTQSDYVPIWVTKAGSGKSGGAGAAPAAPKVTTPVNVSAPVTTQTTTSVSPVFNIAAGSQGITQGGSTSQETRPTSTNQTPQGTSQSGFTPEQMQQMLEQKMREQAALSAQQQTLAIREAELRASQAAWEASQKQQAEFDARLKALQDAQQAVTPMPSQQIQQAPVPLPATPVPPASVPAPDSKYPGLPPGTVIPGAKKETDTVPPPLQAPAKDGKTLPILAALVVGAILLSGKQRNQNRKTRHGKR